MCRSRLRGKLNGEIAPTTPIGSRSVNPSLFWFPGGNGVLSSGIVCPYIRLASSEAKVSVSTPRAVSASASEMGFPTFLDIRLDICWEDCSRRLATFSKIFDLS